VALLPSRLNFLQKIKKSPTAYQFCKWLEFFFGQNIVNALKMTFLVKFYLLIPA